MPGAAAHGILDDAVGLGARGVRLGGKPLPISKRLKEISFTVPNQHTLTDAEVEHIGKNLK